MFYCCIYNTVDTVLSSIILLTKHLDHQQLLLLILYPSHLLLLCYFLSLKGY